MCINFISETTVYPDCDRPNGYHEETGLQCPAKTKVTIIEFCSNNGGGGSDTDGGTTSGNSSSGNGTIGQNGPLGGGSGGGVPTDIGEIITVTIPLSQQQINTKNFILSLNDDESDWYFNQEPEVTSSIIGYISSNNFSSQSQDFIKQSINQIIQNPNVYNSIIPFIIEEQIDDSELDDCTKGILNKLKQNHTFAKIINRFDNPNSQFNIKFTQVPNLLNNGQIAYGQFSGTNQNYNYNIKLNSDFFNNTGATNLGKAKVIIHEMIHALIASVYQSGNSINNSEDFPAIWNSYVNIETGSLTPNDHTFMGYNYVDIITQALQEYQPGLNSEIYDDLAWSGIWVLQPGYHQFNDCLSGTKKSQIYNRNLTEMERSTSFGMNPSSNNPCLP